MARGAPTTEATQEIFQKPHRGLEHFFNYALPFTTAGDGGTFDADVVYFDPSSRARVILEVSIITIGSDTSMGRSAQAGLD